MKDANITRERNLKFFAYDLANFSDFVEKNSLKKYFSVIQNLQNLGFEVSSYLKTFT